MNHLRNILTTAIGDIDLLYECTFEELSQTNIV